MGGGIVYHKERTLREGSFPLESVIPGCFFVLRSVPLIQYQLLQGDFSRNRGCHLSFVSVNPRFVVFRGGNKIIFSFYGM